MKNLKQKKNILIDAWGRGEKKKKKEENVDNFNPGIESPRRVSHLFLSGLWIAVGVDKSSHMHLLLTLM